MKLDIERLTKPRTLSETLHMALMDVAIAALEAAEERESIDTALALLESSIHRLGNVLARE